MKTVYRVGSRRAAGRARVCLDEGVEIVEFERMTAERRAQLEGDEEDPFEMAGTTTLEYRRKDRHVALSDERGHLVASTGIVLTDVEVAGERFPVVGLGGGIVNGDHRGRGLGIIRCRRVRLLRVRTRHTQCKHGQSQRASYHFTGSLVAVRARRAP